MRRADRLFWVLLSRLWPAWREALVIVKPETVIAWHRKGFRWLWTWKSRRRKGGRPPVPREVRELIRRMSRENPLWGAPRVRGELMKLGIKISEATVSKYMTPLPKPPSQTWRTFFRNHADCLAVVPQNRFRGAGGSETNDRATMSASEKSANILPFALDFPGQESVTVR